LRAAIEALHDHNSASFHHWLTPQQFGAQWGAADSDIAAVTAWLASYGFKVAGPTPGRTLIEFSGTAGQIESAFHTTIHAYIANGVLHHANAADPSIPEAMAPVVAGISALNDFRPRPQLRQGPRGVYDSAARRMKPAPESAARTAGIRPQLTSSGAFGDFLYVGPADAATIYNSPIPALNPAANGATIDGAGAVIGVIGDSSISTAQLANYRTLFGLAPNAVQVILDGSTNPGENDDAVEAYLDTEVANGIAPGAQLYYYVAADTTLNYGVDLASVRAVNDNLVDVLNLSFGECEAALGSANALYAGLWEQAAAQGISVTVSSGDSGSAGCDDANTQTEAQYGLQVNGLASTPYDIAVGGTDFAALAGPDGGGADFTNYVAETSDPATLRSALGPIPETPWNDAIASFPPTTVAASIPYTVPYANIVAAGGGKSGCLNGVLTDSGFICAGSYAKPGWQSAPGVPLDGVRDLPDIALFAANGLDYAAWGICTDQDHDGAGNAVTDCTLGSNGLPANEFYIYGVGGTSASAPAMAGVLALVRQQTGERQGQANYVLYNLARTLPSIFRDVTAGNNSVPCAAGSADCAVNGEGANLMAGYDAGSGYDLASGLGSFDISALLANWASVGLIASTTQLTLTPTTVEHGETVNADVTVTASSGQATGQVALNAVANPATQPVGMAIGNYPLQTGPSSSSTGMLALGLLPAASYRFVAAYGGSDSVAQSASSPVTLTVTREPSTTLVTVTSINPATSQSIGSGAVPYGYSSEIQALPYGDHSTINSGKPVPDGVATGTVTFTEGAQALGAQPLGSDGAASVQGSLLSPGSYSIRAAYSGDNNLDPSTGSYALVVSKAATAAALSASQTSYNGQPIDFTITLGTESSAAAPTGTVQLKYGSTLLGTGELTGTAGSSTTLASAMAMISISNPPPGTNNLEAVYLGDGNYAGSTSNTVAVTGKPAFTLANISMTLVGEHTTGAAYLPVASGGIYAGTVKLSCVLVSANGEADPPECAMYPATVTLAAGGKAQAEILVFGKGTKLPRGTTPGDARTPAKAPATPLRPSMALAVVLLFGIPARRGRWRELAPVLLLLAVFAAMTACQPHVAKVSAGHYQFTVTGVDSQDATIQSRATVSVRVL